MKTYFYRGRYTSNAWRNLIAEPKDIGEILGVDIESFDCLNIQLNATLPP